MIVAVLAKGRFRGGGTVATGQVLCPYLDLSPLTPAFDVAGIVRVTATTHEDETL